MHLLRSQCLSVLRHLINKPIALVLVKICLEFVKDSALHLEELATTRSGSIAFHEVQYEPFLALTRNDSIMPIFHLLLDSVPVGLEITRLITSLPGEDVCRY